ncbi:MAG: hypothetical protein RLZZ216_1481 [Cyanobacteriota bacterium]
MGFPLILLSAAAGAIPWPAVGRSDLDAMVSRTTRTLTLVL